MRPATGPHQAAERIRKRARIDAHRIARWQLRAELALITAATVLVLYEALAAALTRMPA